MSAIPGTLDTDRQPPMIVPLRHFVVGLVFLLAGAVVGLGVFVDAVPGFGALAHVHLLLAGWVCLTIMGAMTQFVPVWSNVAIHSRRLANLQLLAVGVGVFGFALAFVLTANRWLAVFGAVMLFGFWTFAYNIARTLAGVDGYDVTEGHFLLALAFFVSLSVLGITLAINLSAPALLSLPFGHGNLLGAHVTLAVFGAVLTTIYGALYQLGTMFTQTELHGIDHRLQSVEEFGHPAGVVLLSLGRLADSSVAARIGGLSIIVAALAVGVVLGRKLLEMRVEWTPMHRRYAVLVPALAVWGLVSLPAWASAPTARAHLFGADGAVHLLVLGVVGFVVVGTLYHVIPFVIWEHQYSDRIGFESVPMIDDLYDDRLALADLALLLGGTTLLVASDLVVEAPLVAGLGGLGVTLGVAVFAANMLVTIRRHSPRSLAGVVFGSLVPGGTEPDRETATTPTDSEHYRDNT